MTYFQEHSERPKHGPAGWKVPVRELQFTQFKRLSPAQFAIDRVEIDAAMAYAFAFVGIVKSSHSLGAACSPRKPRREMAHAADRLSACQSVSIA